MWPSMIEVMVCLWNVEMWFKLLSVPESPPMGHYGTLVVAGLSDHTLTLRWIVNLQLSGGSRSKRPERM